MKLPVMTVTAATAVNEKLKKIGVPPTDKVVIAISNKDAVRESGLIIPAGDKEDVPRRGVLVQVGPLSEDFQYMKDQLSIGVIITYGNYAGKTITPDNIELPGFDLKVLSLNEVAYYENNIK